MAEISHGYLRFRQGEAKDQLSQAFGEETDAFRRSLHDLINNYCQMHDHAGPQCAEFVAALPHNNDQYQEAFLGRFILEETDSVLSDILEEDAELRRSVIGIERSDDAIDRQIREDSALFDERHRLANEEEILRSAREGMLSERDYSDIAAGGNSAEIEDRIARSMRGQLDGLGRMRIQLHIDRKGKPLPPGSARTKWELEVPDLAGQPPVSCFQESTQWVARSIVHIAQGSLDERMSPRIQPLMDVGEEQFRLTPDKVLSSVRSIFQKTLQLQPPLPDHADEFEDTLLDLAKCDPRVAIHSVEIMLHKFFPDDARKLMRIFRGVDVKNHQNFVDALLRLVETVRSL